MILNIYKNVYKFKYKLIKNLISYRRYKNSLIVLCFIEIKNIKIFKGIILKKLEEFGNLKDFILYLNKNIFKLDPHIYNYSKLVEYNIKKNETKYLEKLYTSNNICESINSKINYNLPKKVSNPEIFINCISKFILNEDLKTDKLIRRDYITKAIILLIKELNFNENLKWIPFEDFMKFQKKCINENEIPIEDYTAEQFILYINHLDSDKEQEPKELDESKNKKDNIESSIEHNLINENESNINKKENSNNDSIISLEIVGSEEDNSYNIKNNNLVDLFEDLNINKEIIEENKESNKDKPNDNIDIDQNTGEDDSNRFKYPLKERIKERINKDISSKIKIKLNEKKPKKRKHDYISDDDESEIKYNYPKDIKYKKRGWK